jgi:phosphatidylserine/phosphatidylglycerophosphate/cardiolipin synthase-like enzyme
MDEVEMVAAVLYASTDPIRAADSLFELLSADPSPESARAYGFNPSLVDTLRSALPRDSHELRLACARGAGWVLGRQSIPTKDKWELVASLPAGAVLPMGIRRTTGETIVGLMNLAERRLRFAAPYVDAGGIAAITDSVVAATLRGVEVEVFDPPHWAPATAAIRALQSQVRAVGNVERLAIRRATPDAPWAHLKVVVADSAMAYIGSANITEAGLLRNLELGVLVSGGGVAAIEHVLDLTSQ